MRRALESPVAALLSLSLLAAWPLLRAGYPTLGDGLIHFYRLVEFDHLLRQGVWFPRWAPDLAYGYGYPLFNFYPPLVYYAGALFHSTGLSFAGSLAAVYMLAFGLAATGAYALAREFWGEWSGLLGAAAYGLAPYLYFDAFGRSALAETWALGLLPWVLWAYVVMARRPGVRAFLAATLLYAGLLLSHTLSALIAAPLLLLFIWIMAAGGWPLTARRSRADRTIEDTAHVTRHPPSRSTALRPCGIPAGPITRHSSREADIRHAKRSLVICHAKRSFVISFSLSAYFLLPALFETRHVQIAQLTLPGDLDFHNHFLNVPQLFALPQTYDPRLAFVSLAPSLSLAALAVALLALILRLYRREWDWRALRLWAVFLLLCGLTLPLSLPLWERIPFARLIQFPWRLVGPASLILALLAASAAPLIESLASRSPYGRWALRLGLPALLFFYSLPWTFSPPSEAPPAPGVGDIAAYELASGQLGTTSTGEFLPEDVRELPDPRLLRAPDSGQPAISRLAALPAGVALVSQSAAPASAEATVMASAPGATLTFNIFYFPGWQAVVDGSPAPIRPSHPHGLIEVPIDSGRHTVVVRFGPTPVRMAGGLLSLGALGICGALALGHWLSKRSPAAPTGAQQTDFPHARLLPFALTCLALLFIRIAFVDGRDSLFYQSRFDGVSIAGAGQALDVNFEDQLVLIGLDLPRAALAADEALPLTLYWRAHDLPRADYASTVQVVDEQGNLFGQSDAQHPGRVPTSRWRPGQYARDEHTLRLLPGTPPGTYRLMAGVYQPGGQSLSVLDENRIPQGQAHPLATLTVTRANRPPAQIDAAQPLDLSLGPLTLAGLTLNTTSPQAGDELRLVLFWRVLHAPLSNLQLRLEVAALDGALIQSITVPPARPDYPTSIWQPGEIVRAPLRLQIPALAPAGPAELRASLSAPDGPVPLAALDVRVPARVFTSPAISHPRADELGGAIRLLGYDLGAGALTLYWQAVRAMDVSYTTFVHALAADGRILAQVDTLPAQGARPTTGWLPGEIVAETYRLPLAGAARIEAGFYQAESGARLGTVVIQP